MRRVLITGAAGFIGRHCLAPLLDRGFEVHALAHRRVPEVTLAVTWRTADLLAEGEPRRLIAIVRPTHLLHFAWYVASGRFWTAPDNHQSEQATRLALRNLYGASKLDFFRILDAYARQSGLSAAWGRVFYLFGPHEDPQRFLWRIQAERYKEIYAQLLAS